MGYIYPYTPRRYAPARFIGVSWGPYECMTLCIYDNRSARDISGVSTDTYVLGQPIRQPRGDVHVEPRRTEGVLAARPATLPQR